MSLHLRVWLAVIGWVGAVTLVHLSLNTRALDFRAAVRSSDEEQFRVGFLPVT
jgi:hypothetical protein